MTSHKHDQPGAGPRMLGLRLAAGFLLVVAVLALSQVFKIGQAAGYTVVGPRVFPIVVATGLLGLGVLFLLRTTVWPDLELAREVMAEDAATHWPTVGLLLLALAVYPFLVAPLGYVLATSLFFPLVARILGSRKLPRDAIIGVVLSVVVYLLFTRALGVRLPAGLLAGIL